MFLGKTLFSHVPLSAQVYKWVPANLLLGGDPAMDYHPIQGGVEILLVASCYRNLDKLRSDGPLGSYADLTYLTVYTNLGTELVQISGRLTYTVYTIVRQMSFNKIFNTVSF